MPPLRRMMRPWPRIESAKANVRSGDRGQRDVVSRALLKHSLILTTPRSNRRSVVASQQPMSSKAILSRTAAKLATVVNRNQVFANFSVSDREMLRFMKAQTSGVETGREA